MADKEEEELAPTQTAGYNPGEKKTLEELAKLDAQDGMYDDISNILAQHEPHKQEY